MWSMPTKPRNLGSPTTGSSGSSANFTNPSANTTSSKGAPTPIPLDLHKVPVRVDVVNLDGISRTKDDYVQPQLNHVFKATNFEELVLTTSQVQQKLESMGCFRNVRILIDTNKNVDASPDGYEVTFAASELGRFVGSVNTMAGANEGSIVFAVRVPNILGRGERVSCEHTISTSHDRGSSLSFYKPFIGPWNSEFNTTFFRQKLTNTFSSYNLSRTGGLLDFAFESAQRVKHNMQWEGEWRELNASSRSTSMAVRQQSGQSFKSVLRHVLTVDHRDQPIFPTSGVSLRLVQEFAGVGGDVAYVKHDSHLQVNIPFPFDTVLQGSLRLGVLRPLEAKVETHNIHDMFFLGGPCGTHLLRGFEMKSIGPRSGRDVLGGQAYWTSGLHLYTPLPFHLGQGSYGDYFRPQFFLNAGNIIENSLNTEDFADGLQSLLNNFRASCGIGLALRIGQAARVELNYCWPLKYSKGDKIVPGIQVGLGLEF